MIDPLAAYGDGDTFAVSVRYRRPDSKSGVDLRAPLRQASGVAAERAALPAARISGAVITYRLAVAATDNYVARVGGT